MTFQALLERLLAGQPLDEDEARATMDDVLTGTLGPERLATLLVALRTRPITVDELVGFARSMRSHAIALDVPGPLLDTCGTGGAPVKTFNISTTAAFVAAGAGARIAKHGNRSVTRPSGSADVLERAGARLDLSPDATGKVLDDAGIAFLFAPAFHPAMRHAAPVRKSLGVKTVFNLLGPLCNPAGAQHQVLGVYDPALLAPMSQALQRLGCRGGVVLHGLAGDAPGCDEATPLGPILMARIGHDSIERLDATALGMARCQPADLAPVAAHEAPALVQDLLAGRGTPARLDTVALNAAFALEAAGIASDLQDGLEAARQAMADGSGTAKWQAFIESTQRHA